jgi:hypothetical protein
MTVIGFVQVFVGRIAVAAPVEIISCVMWFLLRKIRCPKDGYAFSVPNHVQAVVT